jgi:hypothetical protein
VEALQDSRLFLDMNPDELRLAIVDVALEFSLLTAYTSLVAVDRTPVRPASAGLVPESIANLLPAGSAMQVHGFSSTATGWPLQLLGAAVLLLLTSSMLWYTPSSRQPRASGNLQAGVTPRQTLPHSPEPGSIPGATASFAREPAPSFSPGWDRAA